MGDDEVVAEEEAVAGAVEEEEAAEEVVAEAVEEVAEELADESTHAELYEEAQEADIEGRSTMDKEELAEAVAEFKVETASEPEESAAQAVDRVLSGAEAAQQKMVKSREVGEASRAETLESRNRRRDAQHEAIKNARAGA